MKPAIRSLAFHLMVWSLVVAVGILLAVSIRDLATSTSLSGFADIAALAVMVLASNALRSPHGPLNVGLMSLVLISVYPLAGPAAAVVVAFIGSLWSTRPVPIIDKLFNSAQRVVTAAAGALVYILTDGPVGEAVLTHEPQALLSVTATTIVYQVVNALLMCAVLSLKRGSDSVRHFLRDVVRPTALPMLGYSYLGLLFAVIWLGGLEMLAGLLVVVPLVVARWALSQDEAEKQAQAATMRVFIQVIEAKDFYTRGHSERVSRGVGMLGRHLQLPEDRQHALENAGLLHDCGKVGVPTSTLRKAGKLDDDEWDAIRLHPARGVELIGDIPFLEEVKSAVLHHHEKYDGTGYPAGLSGKKIPYFARMIGIVDAFDCITSTRPYRPARGVEETLDILVHDKYTHFDPDLVDAFVAVVKRHGWVAEPAEQVALDPSMPATIDHDDLSLGSGGGATGSAAGPA